MINAWIFLLIGWLSLEASAQSGTVSVTVEGVQTAKGGELRIGIFDKANFPKVGKQLFSIDKPATSGRIQVTFTDIPAGEYSLVAFQDIDKNKLLKTNLLGFPTEPIGFSKDAKIKLGPPAFADAKVIVDANKTLTVSITLN